MPSLHPFTFVMFFKSCFCTFLMLISVTVRPFQNYPVFRMGYSINPLNTEFFSLEISFSLNMPLTHRISICVKALTPKLRPTPLPALASEKYTPVLYYLSCKLADTESCRFNVRFFSWKLTDKKSCRFNDILQKIVFLARFSCKNKNIAKVCISCMFFSLCKEAQSESCIYVKKTTASTHHAMDAATWVHPPTSTCPTLFTSAEPIFSAN